MALPTTIKTVRVSFGPFLDFSGEPLRGVVVFTPSASPIVHTASGTPLIQAPLAVELVDGSGSIDVPATDQAGMTVKDWTYRVSIDLLDATSPIPLDFALPAAVPEVDLDLLIPTDGSSGVIVSTARDASSITSGVLDPNRMGMTGTNSVPMRSGSTTSISPVTVATAATANTIPRRGTGGVLEVGTPTADAHAATKAYVDARPTGSGGGGGLSIDPTQAPYNAKGDGVTDDTAALQAALDDAMAVSGSSIELPARTFIVSSIGINYSLAKWPVQAENGEPYGYSSPTFRGQGSKKTQIKQKAGATGDIFTVSGKIGTDSGPANNNKATGARVEALELVGQPLGRHGLYLRSLVNCRFSDLAIRNAGRSGIYFARETFVSAVDDEYSYSNSFHDIKSTANGEYGYATSGAAAIGATFYDCEAIGNTVGGWYLTPTNMTLVGCQAIGNGLRGTDSRGLLAVKNTNATSVNSSLVLVNFRSEDNAGVGGVEVEIATGIGYTILSPNFVPSGGAHCLMLGNRGLGSTGYVQSPLVVGGYYGISTNAFPNQKAIILGTDSRDAQIKLGRINYQGSLTTVESVVTDNGFRTSIEFAGHIRHGANGVLSFMRQLTTEPAARGGEAQLYTRTNASGKIELCVKYPTGVQVISTQA